MLSRVFAFSVILFSFEMGFFLMFVPWSGFWEKNLLFSYAPGMEAILLSRAARSAVSGLGVLNCVVGVSELRRFFASGRSRSI